MSIRKIDDDIRNRYPYPLSGTFHRAYYDTRDSALIHDYLFDLFEVTLKFLTSCVLAQYIQDGAPDSGINQGLLNLQRPSLGHWQGWLRDILRYYQKQKLPLLIPEIGQVFDQKSSGDMYKAFMSLRAMMNDQMDFKGDGKNYQQITTQQFFDLLGQYRNKVAHGAKLNIYDRRQVVEWLLPAMRELFVSLSFTADYRVVFINEVKLAGSRRQMSYEHFITDLTGYRPGIVTEPYIMDRPAGSPEELYICAKGEDFAPMLSLHPFMIYTFCKDCSTEQAFVLNQSREDTLSYLSYQCSHQFSLRDYLDDIESILTPLRNGATLTKTAGVISFPNSPKTAANDNLSPEELERRKQRDTERKQESERREAEDQQRADTAVELENRQHTIDLQLSEQRSLLSEERRKLDEERQKVAAHLEALRQEQEAREKQRAAEDQRVEQAEAQKRAAAAAAQTIICPNCQRLNAAGKKFCANCGTKLAPGATPQSQQSLNQQLPQQVPQQNNWQQPAYNQPNQQPQQGPQPNYYNQPQQWPQNGQQGYNGQNWNQPVDQRQGWPVQQPQNQYTNRQVGQQPTQQPATNQQPPTAGTKTCPNCQRVNPAARKFCSHCGLNIANLTLDGAPAQQDQQKQSGATAPLSQQPVANGSLGTQTANATGPLPQQPAAIGEKTCPNCQRVNPATRKFCTHCGANLTNVPIDGSAHNNETATNAAPLTTPQPQSEQPAVNVDAPEAAPIANSSASSEPESAAPVVEIIAPSEASANGASETVVSASAEGQEADSAISEQPAAATPSAEASKE